MIVYMHNKRKERYKKMKKIIANHICVDAGMIMVADCSYLNDHPCKDKPEKTGEVFNVPNGLYLVDWRIRNTWHGDIEDQQTLRVTSGKIFVSDPCYLIGSKQSQWLAWLEKTSYGDNLADERAFIIDEMGGDGSYKVELKLTEQRYKK
jgi:hypothetical protein